MLSDLSECPCACGTSMIRFCTSRCTVQAADVLAAESITKQACSRLSSLLFTSQTYPPAIYDMDLSPRRHDAQSAQRQQQLTTVRLGSVLVPISPRNVVKCRRNQVLQWIQRTHSFVLPQHVAYKWHVISSPLCGPEAEVHNEYGEVNEHFIMYDCLQRRERRNTVFLQNAQSPATVEGIGEWKTLL